MCGIRALLYHIKMGEVMHKQLGTQCNLSNDNLRELTDTCSAINDTLHSCECYLMCLNLPVCKATILIQILLRNLEVKNET